MDAHGSFTEHLNSLENNLNLLASLYGRFFAGYRGNNDFEEGVPQFKGSTEGWGIFTGIIETTKQIGDGIDKINMSLDNIEVTEELKTIADTGLIDLASTLLYIMGLNQSFQNNPVIESNEKQEVNVEYQQLITRIKELNRAIIDRKERLRIMSINDALERAKELQNPDRFAL